MTALLNEGCHGGLRILDKIEALNFATLQTRPRLGPRDVVVMLWRSLWM